MLDLTMEKPLLIEDIQEILDDIIFRPFGQDQTWYFTASEDDEIPEGYIRLMLTNNFAWNSRDFDFTDESIEYNAFDMHSQYFAQNYLRLTIVTKTDLYNALAQLVAWAFAHESLEWLRYWEGNEAIMLHDPHTDGEVQVSL